MVDPEYFSAALGFRTGTPESEQGGERTYVHRWAVGTGAGANRSDIGLAEPSLVLSDASLHDCSMVLSTEYGEYAAVD
jgi:hypothetical protein